jgi:hypothetical protein
MIASPFFSAPATRTKTNQRRARHLLSHQGLDRSPPFSEYDRLVEKYGEKRADRLIRLSIKHYIRLALIDTGHGDMDRYRSYAQRLAERWDLRFEELQGSNSLVRKMLAGPWDDEFIVVPPGDAIRFEHFFPTASLAPNSKSRL